MPSKRKGKGKGNGKQKGGAYEQTMNSLGGNAAEGMGGSYSSPVPYNHCGGSKGGDGGIPNAIFNNSGGYGFTSAGAQMSSQVMGSYAPPTPYVTSQCGAGRKTKKAKKGKNSRKSIRKKNRKNKTRKTMRKHNIRRRCRRCNKINCRCKQVNYKKKSRKSRKQKGKSKKHYQKGGSLGYSQFNSNTPMGSSYEMPAVGGPMPALANGGFNKTNINCTDNYNHYLRK